MPTFEDENLDAAPSPKAHKAHKGHKKADLPEDASEVAKVQAEGNAAISDMRDSMHPEDESLLGSDEQQAAELDAGYKQRLAEMQGKKDALAKGSNPKDMTNPTNITSPATHLHGPQPQPVDEGEP
jgi:hypothetical protein